jgi:hypothetical protein
VAGQAQHGRGAEGNQVGAGGIDCRSKKGAWQCRDLRLDVEDLHTRSLIPDRVVGIAICAAV